MEKKIRAIRAAMRKKFPTAFELVYDNYNFLVFGFCATERASDALFSIAANRNGVSLMFLQGATLPDPEGILQGSGTQNRFVRLENAGTLDEAAVKALIAAAVEQADPPLPVAGRGATIVRSVSAKQRPRR